MNSFYLGPKAFIYDFSIWTNSLSSVFLNSLYHSSIPLALTSAIDEGLRIVSLSKLPQKIPFLQSECASSMNEGLCLGNSDGAYTSDEIDPLFQQSYHQMKLAWFNCSTEKNSHYLHRLEVYHDFSMQGLPEALFAWASLKAFGFESPSSSCPFSTTKTNSQDIFADQREALISFIAALYTGEPRALLPIALILSSGLGSMYGNMSLDEMMVGVPLPEHLHVDRSFIDMIKLIMSTSRSSITSINSHSHFSHSSQITEANKNSSLVNGLLLLAGLFNMDEARAILSHQFEYGIGFEQDIETSLFYMHSGAKAAAIEFHSKGGEPIAERDRIDDLTERAVFKGNLGDEDELIQHQMVKAKEGDVPSILAMGDLYYYGARGMPRDQTLARQYFSDAASRGSLEGICGLAGMFLKGEGGETNLTRAIELYESAATQGSIRALNGLGYLYFFGNDIEKNEVDHYLCFQSLE